jgi:hypothetical protein
MAGPIQQAEYIISTDIPKNLILFYGSKDELIFCEVLWFFYQGLLKGSKTTIVAILKLNFKRGIIKFINFRIRWERIISINYKRNRMYYLILNNIKSQN